MHLNMRQISVFRRQLLFDCIMDEHIEAMRFQITIGNSPKLFVVQQRGSLHCFAVSVQKNTCLGANSNLGIGFF